MNRIVSILKLSLVTYLGLTMFVFVSITHDTLDGAVHQTSLALEKLGHKWGLAALYTASVDPDMIYIALDPGLRKEQIAEVYRHKLGWTELEVAEFIESDICSIHGVDGYLFPGVYAVPSYAKPADVKLMMRDSLYRAIRAHTEDGASPIDNSTMLTMASIIQREAAGKSDMDIISGILWNRILSDTKLDIDATLQYVKGEPDNWWPQVSRDDKYIDSPYNTYMYKGLPPGAISNPGLDAIVAVRNPAETPCIFYLHDKFGRIHCSRTYPEHEYNVDKYLKVNN